MLVLWARRTASRFSTFLGYNINTENTETDYHSGQVFHIDATVAEHLPLGKGFIGIGVNGFYLDANHRRQRQRRAAGELRGNDRRRRTGAYRPPAPFGKTSIAAELKWLPQIDAQKTLKGDYIWFKIGVQF